MDETSTVDQPGEAANESPATDNSKTNKLIKNAVASCKNYRRKLIKNWDTSVSYRKGMPFLTQSDEDRIAVNLDWSYTKMKQASLFSQVPAARVSHSPQTIAKEMDPWLHKYEQRINDLLQDGGIEATMDEVLPDCINAAGVGIAIVYHETITTQVEVPAQDLSIYPPQLQAMIMQHGMLPNGSPIEMTLVPKVLDQRYVISRVSPSDFLWPLSFDGSDFDEAQWLGRSGQVSWAIAKRRWNLDPAKKDQYCGTTKHTEDRISQDIEKDTEAAKEEYVAFDEIFYKEEFYNPDVKQFDAIRHLIFVNGQDEPVVDEPWKGQETHADQEGSEKLVGALKFPIRVLTLSYITDEAIPPSDSAISRPQVDELNKSRTQMMLQRQHSFPVRTFDVNRVDPSIQFNLMRGTWQGMIPVQGNGQNIIAEISRSSFPQENFTFDSVIKADASLAWQVGQDPLGNDIETKGEANVVQANYQTRIARERAKVGSFFCGIAEVLGGLVSIYEDPASFGEGFTPEVSRTLGYSILADSTVLLDSQQRLKRLTDFVNMYAKSGWMAIEPVIKEAATLSGLDPSVVVRPPSPPPPAEPNLSIRVSGAEDMMNPLVLAGLIDPKKIPTAESIEQAKKLIEAAMMPSTPQVPQLGPDGKLLPPTPPMSTDGPPLAPGDDNPNWSAMSKINQRIVDRGKQ